MRLYEIQTPAGSDIFADNLAFEADLVRIAGGFSKRPMVDGVWRDDRDGKLYREPMIPYHVALAEPSRLAEIMASASRLWPKEVAWYVAELGEVTIWPSTIEADSSPAKMTDDELISALFPAGMEEARAYAERVEGFQAHKSMLWPAGDVRTVGDDYPTTAPLGRIAASHESPIPGGTVRPFNEDDA